jgi:hypothetical protein
MQKAKLPKPPKTAPGAFNSLGYLALSRTALNIARRFSMGVLAWIL